jgi:hypothetical protein
MDVSGNTCSEEGCSESPLEDYERCAYHRAKLEESRRKQVKRGLGVLGTIVVALFWRGNGDGSS